MKISLHWLNDYIDIHDYFAKPAELAERLTAAGLEVESIEDAAKNFNFVVVGHILQKAQHPNADRLTLCQVSTGEGVVHQIVCGAKNHKEGDRVVVALPGAILPGDFAIKRSAIRGVESGGMLCSEKELGLKTESEGILILPTDATVGQPFATYMGLDDILFELKVTPNRADCLSHFGLAREIGTLLDREVRFPIEPLHESSASTREQMGLELKEPEMCPRYAGRGVRGVKVGPTPTWMKKRLESVGLKSINNVVDVTNFVMMELGAPLHAFDVRDIRGRKIIVDRAVKGETFTTLDGTHLTLDGTELTIRDTERPVALAGIIGGKNSGIKDDTSEVFIEAAYFTPATVRRTARKFGLETDSSYRFARGTNPEAIQLAMNRAAQLIQNVAGGEILGEAHDQYPNPIRRESIDISLKTVADRLGDVVDPQVFVKWMQRLGCRTEPKAGAGPESAQWSVQPPMYRWDLTFDMDLIEEFARLNGYDHIPETLPAISASPSMHDPQFLLESKLRRLLQAAGCLQAVNESFIGGEFLRQVLGDPEPLKAFGLRAVAQPVKLLNPLNEEINTMRTSLVPGLLKNVVHNSRHGNSFGRVFEHGFAHYSELKENRPSYGQEARLAFAFWLDQPNDLWAKAKPPPPIFQLKAVVENLLRELNISRYRWVHVTGAEAPQFLHPAQCARLECEGKPVGFIGTLHPAMAAEHKIREVCAFGEFNLERLGAGQPRAPKYASISKFPAVERDLAFVMPSELAAGQVEDEVRKVGGELLRDVRVFDVFEGGALAAGQKSVAFRLLFQSQSATLEDQTVNDLCEKVIVHVSEKFSIALR